jgi:hypothetical protein
MSASENFTLPPVPHAVRLENVVIETPGNRDMISSGSMCDAQTARRSYASVTPLSN